MQGEVVTGSIRVLRQVPGADDPRRGAESVYSRIVNLAHLPSEHAGVLITWEA